MATVDLNYLIPRQGDLTPYVPPMAAFGQGALTPLQISNALTGSALAQEKLAQFQDTRNALAEYAKTKDITPLMGVAPEVAGQVQDVQNKGIATAWQQARLFAGGDPAKYPVVRQSLIDAGVRPDILPAPEAIQTPEQFKNFQYQADQVAAQLEALKKPIVSLGQGIGVNLLTGEVFRGPQTTTTVVNPEGKPLGTYTGTVHVTPRGFKPEILVAADGKGPAIAWEPGTPVPPGYTKPSAIGSKLSEDNMTSVLNGIEMGNINPDQLSKRGSDYNTILAKGQERGINFAQLSQDWKAAQTLAKTMNSTQMVRFNTLSQTVMGTIDRVISLSDQLKLSGIPLVNAAELGTIKNVEGNSPKGQLIGQYLAALTTLKEEYANFAQGGYAPTESAFKLSNDLINQNYGSAQMRATLEETKRLVNIRRNAFKEVSPLTTPGPTKTINTLPPANSVKIDTMATDTVTGIKYKSDGKNWVKQ